MKIHITDENGDIVETIVVFHTVLVEVSDGSSFELDDEKLYGKNDELQDELQIWAGRRPWVASSKDIKFRDQCKALTIRPGAANVIRLSLKD